MDVHNSSYVAGQTYVRRGIHDRYGGQRQGGISTPAGVPFIFLFTGSAGTKFGYKDGWVNDGIFELTGEGQVGDMVLTRGNRAIAEHANDGKDLFLFESLPGRGGRYRYIGQMVCCGFHYREGLDRVGGQRQILIFDLRSIDSFGVKEAEVFDSQLWKSSMGHLRELALSKSSESLPVKERIQKTMQRSEAVKIYALKRAVGTCEACGQSAPFKNSNGEPYLESHHLRRVSDGGPDHPGWVAAICPNCHRRIHFGEDGNKYNDELSAKIRLKEPQAN